MVSATRVEEKFGISFSRWTYIIYFQTYFGTDVTSFEDPVKRKAMETMVKTYGQTPKMLFSNPHPARMMGDDGGGRGDAIASHSKAFFIFLM